MPTPLEKTWQHALEATLGQERLANLLTQVEHLYASSETVYPAQAEVFNAFAFCPLDQVKVVILGQDPYHGPGQAHGLAFSVPVGVPIPPSLQNIYKEIAADIGTPPPPSGNLERWATQGVLLLNSSLTVAAGRPGSHQSFGWEGVTDAVVRVLAHTEQPIVFMLWGAFAQRQAREIDTNRHCVLTAPHPSPLSAYRGFFGCRHFSQANAYLTAHGQAPIQW